MTASVEVVVIHRMFLYTGMDISPIDLINIQMFASRVIGLVKYRSELNEYLSQRMNNVAPNLTTLIGEQVHVYMTCALYYTCNHDM